MPETTKKPIKIVPNTIKTIPKIKPATIIPKKTLEDQLEEIYDEIDIDVDDLPDELLEVYEELEGTYKEKSIQKNWKLWLSMFTPFILPAFIKGVSGQVTLPYDARQSVQSNAPEPKVVVDYAKKYFEEHGLELVKTLSKTDCERLKVQLKDNWGKGPDAFKKSFQEDYANTKARLDSIYRTEYVTAQNEGILARSRDAGHKMKQWNAALDERTCPVCGDQLHGTIIPIEEEFTAVVEHKNGSEEISVNGPPAHPNCRCVLTTLDEDDYDEIKEDSAYLEDVFENIKLNYKCKVGTVDDSNACKPTTEQTNELTNLRLDINPKSKEPKKPRSTTPDRFFETNLSTNINQELSSSITSVIKEAYKNIPELNGVPLKVVNVNEKENRDLENAYAAHDMNKIYLNDKYFSDIGGMQEKLTKEVESGFHPKGCNTAESIITHELGHLLFDGMAFRGDEKWDNISEVIQEAKDSGELAKVSRYALSEAGNGELSEAASEIFASIFHTKEEEQEPVVKKVRDILFDDNMKTNESYLEDVTNFIKLNYKCKAGTVDDSNKCNLEQTDTTNTVTLENKKIASFISNALQKDPRRMFHGYVPQKGKLLTTNDTGFWLDAEGKSYVHKKLRDIPENKRNDLINVHSHVGQDREQLIVNKKDVADFKNIESFSGGDFQMLQFNIKNGYGRKIAVIVAPDEYDYFEVPEEKLGEFIKIKDITNKFEAHSSSLEESRKFLMEISNKNGFVYKPAIKFEQKQNSSYLADAFETIKLNYKCPKGTVDDTNACGLEGQTSKPSETFIGFKSDHDFSSPQDIEANKRIQASLDKAAEPLKKFKPEDRRILKQYSVNRYIDVNQYLNGTLEKEVDQDSSILRHAKEDVDALDKLFSEANLQEPLVTYRGLKDDIIVKNPELRDALDTPGSQIEFPCFSSTSALPFMANNFAVGYNGRLLELQLPIGTKALFIAEESGLPNEFEILVNRGTKFEVVETRHTDIIPPNNGSYVNRSTKRVKITTIKAIV